MTEVIDATTGCLGWIGQERMAEAARSISWQIEHSALPVWGRLMALCMNDACINPGHMIVVAR
jgi:hypothetical protein